MKHLVLGSSGQIGTHLVGYLRSIGEEVQEFDIARNPIEDLRQPTPASNSLFDECLNETDFVHFLAFDVGGSKFLGNFENKNVIDNNLMIMKNVFDGLERTGKPFIFSSSQMSNMNHSSYGVLKRLGEFYTESKGMNGVSVKYWNVYGNEINHDSIRTHVLTDFIKQAQEHGNIRMMTDGSEERQFLHALDCAKAHMAIVKNFNSLNKSKPYHITSFEWTKIADIAKIVGEYFQVSNIRGSENKDSVQRGIRNEPDPYIKAIWSPEFSLKDGIWDICKQMSF
jgi:nucleoside-diphosphate-sugar epimerase